MNAKRTGYAPVHIRVGLLSGMSSQLADHPTNFWGIQTPFHDPLIMMGRTIAIPSRAQGDSEGSGENWPSWHSTQRTLR